MWHAGARTVRRRSHSWLCHGRRWSEDVKVSRQHHVTSWSLRKTAQTFCGFGSWGPIIQGARIGPDIVRHHTDIYRRLRNTLRFLLGNLAGFDETERPAGGRYARARPLALHRLSELDGKVRQACVDYEFHPLFTELHTFCSVDLSAFYFDIRKDALYCERDDSIKRRAVRTVLDEVFSCLTAWLAPFICFTAEEAWLARFPGESESVHLRLFPNIPADWQDDALADKWLKIRNSGVW